MVSAYGDMANLRAAMNRGAFEIGGESASGGMPMTWGLGARVSEARSSVRSANPLHAALPGLPRWSRNRTRPLVGAATGSFRVGSALTRIYIAKGQAEAQGCCFIAAEKQSRDSYSWPVSVRRVSGRYEGDNRDAGGTTP
jgi:hypothetical protein